ncbi:hypothetical protein O3P69_010469 [Scylla paramamosain]|uniref:Uncharacterized protein n=1 Tax=Scylla paramamosain TaxID=85552 RepID=A0AAW0TX80_SCYPA
MESSIQVPLPLTPKHHNTTVPECCSCARVRVRERVRVSSGGRRSLYGKGHQVICHAGSWVTALAWLELRSDRSTHASGGRISAAGV